MTEQEKKVVKLFRKITNNVMRLKDEHGTYENHFNGNLNFCDDRDGRDYHLSFELKEVELDYEKMEVLFDVPKVKKKSSHGQ